MTTAHLKSETTFTQHEQQALSKLRARYENDCDCFSRREQAYLRFTRWLKQTGRLTS